ncbi:phage tail tape measure protein [Roseibium sediminicola]|uniref:Uncharacterized protein n=1 Tax=Roseibium sediminicola TaxID=2933272 RepID=A0ABT0GR98_9HYPH|nr:phage tail tape measure protein [Roseibium sp. CAU 1639]MCK7611963.1 hypothetical protein [Roseibium sp. CAU 1639]
MAPRTPQVGVRLAALDGKVVQREFRKFGKEGEAALQRIQKASAPTSRSLKAVDASVNDMKSSAAGLSARIGPLGSALSALGPVGLAASVGIGALSLGLAVATDRSRDAVAAITEVANSARRAGLDVQDFQELGYVAEVNQISIDALTDGIKELNLRADEFIVTGKGSAAEAFQRLGFSADELSERLRNPADLMVEIIKRTEDLDRAAQIRIADELFGGTGGERFVELIDRGSASVQDLVREFRELGIGFDRNMIDKAEEADREFRKLGIQLDNDFKKVLIDLAPVALAVSGAIVKITGAVRGLIDALSDFEDRSAQGRARALDRLREDLARQDEKIRLEQSNPNTVGFVKTAELNQLQEERSRIRRELTALEQAEFRIHDRESTRRLGTGSTINEPTEADRAAAEAWRKRILTADEERKIALQEIDKLEKGGLLTAEAAALSRLDAEKTYAAAIKKTGTAGRKEEAKLLREVQSLLKTSATPAQELETRLKRIAELQKEGVFDKATGGKGEAAANAARVTAMREYLGAAEDTAGALEKLRQLAQDGIGADALAAQIALAERAGKSFGETMKEVGGTVADSITDAIFDAGEEAKDFGDIMKSLARQLARDFLNSNLRNLFGQITGGLGGGYGGGGSGILSILTGLLGGGRSSSSAVLAATAGIYHDGGKIGPGGRTRQVPASLFANAERRHSGGFIGPRERAIIAEDDERVLTLAMQKNTADSFRSLAALANRPAAAMPSASAAPIVNIYPQAGQEVTTQQRQGSNGAAELDVILGPIERALATKVAEGGKLSTAIGKRFGLNRANGLAG